ncbi:hypothetical protein H6G00_01245 [Leptolyngbya sp. FACHB-541]|uniref:hypothetical protein n=1 Tax=Leptolyngbya sp. FACHB-541 TaxID=2692810 RepID=UPI001689A766|nr:hypothetical protein [Leptolyngbya sp. FACHB-541]MBD1995255.1 hypothetical protein [Leptolyngbya sp. FACHB-541]
MGEIVGMEYVTPDARKIEDFEQEGWTYRIKTEEAANPNPAGAHIFAWEENVELLKEQ